MRESPSEAILDTNGILALAKGGVLEHLPQLFRAVVCPPQVDPEVQDPVTRSAFEKARATWLEAARPSPETLAALPEKFARDPADQAVIALCLERAMAWVITGDREIASFLASRGRVTVRPERIVVALKRARLIRSGRPVLEKMMAFGYDIPSDRFQGLLKDLGELPED